MAISSNSVIHFTNNFDNIKGIIKSKGFRLKYCSENLKLDNIHLPSASPMVCFCDIPLSEVKNHIDSYGSYGIGLYKTWAKKSTLNPVLYIDEQSEIAKVLKKALNTFFEKSAEDEDFDDTFLETYFQITQYCKKYEGPLKHGKIDDDKYRFYNEREWRYIPNEDVLNGQKQIIFNKDYLKEKKEYNEKLKDIFLNFDVEDISYIIVSDNNEIPEILNIINSVFEDSCTAKQLKVLGTKILTTNQIFNDF